MSSLQLRFLGTKTSGIRPSVSSSAPVFPSDFQSYLISDNLCTCCTKLTECILTGAVRSHPQWEVIHSDQKPLYHCKHHYDGSIKMLLESVDNGCNFCRLIVQELRSLPAFNENQIYCLFQWVETPAKCQIQLAVGEVRRFVMHVSQWSPPRRICFFTKGHRKDLRSEVLSPPAKANFSTPSLYLLPRPDQDSAASYAQASKWLEMCQKNHQECVRPCVKMPDRVLDLGNLSRLEEVKVYVTKGEHHEYATLSYSWGQGTRLLTTRKTLEDHCRSIDLHKFPRTLSDGIHIAKRLGFRYLWIDALCILQKDDKLDFAKQVAALPEIYGRSTLNISASNATTTDDGIFERLPDHGIYLGTFRVDGSTTKEAMIWAGPPLQTLDLEEKFLSSRGWVFQERLVSRATLHYTDEGLVWECGHGTMVEHDQNVYNTDWKSKWAATMERKSENPASSRAEIQLISTSNHYRKSWFEWICAYSERDLHFFTDKFPAIAGVARIFAEKFNLTYIAGLWKEDLISGLLWRRHNRKETLTRYSVYVAPTWSWGSVAGQLEYRNVDLADSQAGPKVKVLNIDVKEDRVGSFGCVLRGGTMLVEGLLQKVLVDSSTHPGVRQKDFQECGVVAGFVNEKNVLVMLDVRSSSDDATIPCFGLRLGSFDAAGRRGDMFLLLQRENGDEDYYRRIGLAETDPWHDALAETPYSGLLKNSKPSRVVLI